MIYSTWRGVLKKTTLKDVLDRRAEESVTDEQVERALAPVLAMIRAGAFDRPKRKRFNGLLWFFAAAALTLVVMAAPWTHGGQTADNGPAVIQDGAVPLAAPPTANILSGRALYSGGTAGEVTLRLFDANTREIVAETRAAPDGSYVFSGFPDGTYGIEATLPSGDTDTATVQSSGQAGELTFGQGTRTMEGVDITG